jgi:hypothetical protein
MRLVAEHARTVLVLVDGAVAFAGPPADLFADAALLARAHLQPPPMLELSRRLFGAPGPVSSSDAAGRLPSTIAELAAVLAPNLAGVGI